MVYARKVEDRDLTMLVSGKLWRNSLIMQDEETGTLWSHVSGLALEGELAGTRLETLPMVQSTWGQWRRAHPATKVLRKSEEVLASHYEGYFNDPDRVGIFRSRYNEDLLPGKSRVYGLISGPFALAVAESLLVAGEPKNVLVGEKPAVIMLTHEGGARAYSALLAGKRMSFVKNEGDGLILDSTSGTIWDLGRGVGVSGKNRGMRLEEMQVLRSFWFAWSSFYPNTEVFSE